MNKNRFKQLLESQIGNVKPLIIENKLQEKEYLLKKKQLLDFLYSFGLETDGSSKETDINNDGEMDTELMTFKTGNVILYLGICNFSDGNIQYICFVKTKPNYEIVLKPTFVGTLDELETEILPYIEKSYEDTKLDYLGVKDQKEYMPSKDEYNDMLNKAIDDEDWEEASRLQKEYGHLYK